MRLWADKSLAFRLISASTLLIILVLSLYTWYAAFYEERRVRNELLGKGELLANLLSSNSRLGVFAENRDLLKDVASGIVAEPDVVLVGIYNTERKQLYLTDRLPANAGVLPWGEAGTGEEGPEKSGVLLRETRSVMEFTKPVVLRRQPNEERALYFGDRDAEAASRVIGYVRIVLGKESMNREILGIVKRNAVTALLIISASVLIVYFIVRTITRPLKTLTQHIRLMGRGAATRVPVSETVDELGKLATAFNTMIEERKASEHAFQKILMDIHDGIGGITTNICLFAEVAQKAPTPAAVDDALNTILGLSREGMNEIRSLMCSLDRKELNWTTFIAELRSRGAKTMERHAIQFELKAEVEKTGSEPGSLLCLHVFRIYQEALTNVIKHSQAKRVRVFLSVNSERLALTVSDDGRGYDPSADSHKGRGLANMKARAAEIGGTVTFTRDQGTHVSVEIRLPIRSWSG